MISGQVRIQGGACPGIIAAYLARRLRERDADQDCIDIVP